MNRINKLTAVMASIFILTLIICGTSLVASNQTAGGQSVKKLPSDEGERIKQQFPDVDYDAPEDADLSKRQERKEKNKRYDRFGFVRKESSTDITESVFHTDWYRYDSALPVDQSTDIVSGKVVSSEGHLSNDKTGVYTEFVVEVDEVLKGGGGNPARGSKISVDRPGGVVRYPGGHKRLYRFADMNMPTVGSTYIFFLTHDAQDKNYRVITGYELSAQGVVPLDSFEIFQTYLGMGDSAFVEELREAIRSSR